MPPSLPSLPPSKKRKTNAPITQTKIKTLEDTLTAAIAQNGSLNPLADLLEVMYHTQDPHETSKAMYALYRVFVVIIVNGKMGLGGDEASRAVKKWIWERMQGYTEFLGGLLKDDEKFLRTSALQILFSLLKHLSTSYSKSANTSKPQPQFHVSHFRKIVSSILLCPPSQRKSSKPIATMNEGVIDPDVLDQFYETWFSVYDDIRWFFLREAGTILNNNPHSSHPHLATNLLSILERLTTFPTEAEELNSWWVEEFGAKPPKAKKVTVKVGDEEDDEDEVVKNSNGNGQDSDNEDENQNQNQNENGENDDDWRKFFEDEKTTTDSKSPHLRLHRMTTHQHLYSMSSHRAVFTRTWLGLLGRIWVYGEGENGGVSGGGGVKRSSKETNGKETNPEATRKALATRVLNLMHRGVIPHLTRPFLVMDWISLCVDLGGSVGLLALNALFVLIKEYNLDYPSFYTRLYAFLDRDVLHSKFRSRFFRLTELFLSSTHLPAALLASFIKRLSYLSLSAPPAAIVMIIPFTYNVLKRHPALMFMIHRVDSVEEGNDPFNPTDPDPMTTQAIDSSLWELMSHSSHYHAPVSTMVKVFGEAFTKGAYGMEDFLDHGYGSMLDTELNRKIKREPALALIDDVKEMEIFPGVGSVARVVAGEEGGESDEESDEESGEESGEGESGEGESGEGESGSGSGSDVEEEGEGEGEDEKNHTERNQKEDMMDVDADESDVRLAKRDIVAELWGF